MTRVGFRYLTRIRWRSNARRKRAACSGAIGTGGSGKTVPPILLLTLFLITNQGAVSRRHYVGIAAVRIWHGRGLPDRAVRCVSRRGCDLHQRVAAAVCESMRYRANFPPGNCGAASGVTLRRHSGQHGRDQCDNPRYRGPDTDLDHRD